MRTQDLFLIILSFFICLSNVRAQKDINLSIVTPPKTQKPSDNSQPQSNPKTQSTSTPPSNTKVVPLNLDFQETKGDGKTIYDPNRAKNITTEEVVVTDNLKLKRRIKDIYANITVEYWMGREKKTGVLRIKLYHLQAPQTVENFTNLVEGQIEFKLPGQDKLQKKPFYDGLVFHRVIRRFVAQTGDPLGNGTGAGPGYTVPLEFNSRLIHDRMGVVSMARMGPSSHGSQFFITLAPIPNLDRVNSVFGQVVDGADILSDFEKVKTNREDIPKRPIRIKSLTINRVYL